MNSLSVERRLQICLAATAALGTLLLGLGESNIVLPIVAMFAAVTSVYFTDHLGWFRLHRHAANVFALGAVGFAVVDVLEQELGRQLIAIANLLIYLQIILLYQQKNLRLYWHLLVLSLLQVVVSAALNLGIEFGFLLIIYMFLALVTLALLFILCETAAYTVGEEASSFSFAHASPQSGFARIGAGDGRARQRPALTAVVSTDRPAESMLTRGLIWQVAKLGLTTLLLTFLVFFLTPRFGNASWRGGQLGSEKLVGFSEEVTLNDIGRILESPEKVMRVQFITEDDLQPYELRSDLYLWGSVLADYEPVSGRWSTLRHRSHDQRPLPLPATHETGIIRQTISLEDSTILFSTMPLVRIPNTPRNIVLSAEMGQLVRQPPEPEGLTGHFRYEVGTRAFIDGRQRDIIPRRYGTDAHGYFLRSMRRYSTFDEQHLPSVREIAESVLEVAQVEPGNRIGQARALEAHLQRLDKFRYTLDLTDAPPDGVDPIEYFLTESGEGHCEYFASALALLLRSQDIPARLVVGYKEGDYNRVGHYYQIRQLHAHAWVEAYLEPEHIPTGALLEGETAEYGAWLRLDPTPVETEPMAVFPGATLLDRFGQCSDYIQMLWNDYILGMDTKRQREAIYRPLMDGTLASFTDYLFNGEWWSFFGTELVEKLGIDSLANFYQRWCNWRAVPVIFGLVLLMVAIYLVLRRPVQRVWGWFCRRIVSSLFGRLWRDRQTDFYYRLERILHRQGLRRRSGQTPHELAVATHQLVSPSAVGSFPEAASLPQLAQEIVDLFYRVRYGGRPLDAAEAKSVERKLAQIQRVFKEVAKSPSSSRK